MENIEAIKKSLIENLPGGEANIKSMFIKSTDQLSVPIFLANTIADPSEIKLKNNMTPIKIKKANKFSLKTKLKRKQIAKSKARLADLNKSKKSPNKKMTKKQNIKLLKVAKATKQVLVEKMEWERNSFLFYNLYVNFLFRE